MALEPLKAGEFEQLFGLSYRSGQGFLGDIVDTTQQTFMQMGEAGLGLIELGIAPLGGGELADATRRALQDGRGAIAQAIQQNFEEMSPEGQEAVRKLWFTTDMEDAVWASPTSMAHSIVGMLPWALVTMVPASIAARGAMSAALRAGATPGAARGAATRAGAIAGGGTEGAISTGLVYGSIVDEVMQASPDELAGSAVYMKLRRDGLTDGEARQELARQIASVPALLAGIGSAGLGAVSGGALGQATGQGIWRGARRQAGFEAIPEGAQEIVEGAAQWAALQADLPGRAPSGSELAEAAAHATFGGGVLGGAGGAWQGRRMGAGPEHQAALSADQVQRAPAPFAIPEPGQPAGPAQPAEPPGAVPAPYAVPETPGPPAPPVGPTAPTPQQGQGRVGATPAQEQFREPTPPATSEEIAAAQQILPPDLLDAFLSPQNRSQPQVQQAMLDLAQVFSAVEGADTQQIGGQTQQIKRQLVATAEAEIARITQEYRAKQKRGPLNKATKQAILEIENSRDRQLANLDQDLLPVAQRNVRLGQATDAIQRVVAGEAVPPAVAAERIALGVANLPVELAGPLMEAWRQGPEAFSQAAAQIVTGEAQREAGAIGIQEGAAARGEMVLDPLAGTEIEEEVPTEAALLRAQELRQQRGAIPGAAEARQDLIDAEKYPARSPDISVYKTAEQRARAEATAPVRGRLQPTPLRRARPETRARRAAKRQVEGERGAPLYPLTTGEALPGVALRTAEGEPEYPGLQRAKKAAAARARRTAQRREAEAGLTEEQRAARAEEGKAVSVQRAEAAAGERQEKRVRPRVARQILGDLKPEEVPLPKSQFSREERKYDRQVERIKRLNRRIARWNEKVRKDVAFRTRVGAAPSPLEERRPVPLPVPPKAPEAQVQVTEAERVLGAPGTAEEVTRIVTRELDAIEADIEAAETAFEEEREAAPPRSRRPPLAEREARAEAAGLPAPRKKRPRGTRALTKRREERQAADPTYAERVRAQNAILRLQKIPVGRRKFVAMLAAADEAGVVKANRELPAKLRLNDTAMAMVMAWRGEALEAVDHPSTPEMEQIVAEEQQQIEQEIADGTLTPYPEGWQDRRGEEGVDEQGREAGEARRGEGGAAETPRRRSRRKERVGEPAGGVQPGPGPADAGTDRGGRALRPRDIQVLDGGAVPEPNVYVDGQSYRTGEANDGLRDHQQFGVNLALTRLLQGKPFMLGDGQGTGKSRQLLAVADQMRQHSGKPSLVVAEKPETFEASNGAFAKDATAMGLKYNDGGGIEITTYDRLKSNPPTGDYGVVIFDEAHNLKNVEAQKTQAASALKADVRMFATGTPMDRPTAAAYFVAQLRGVPTEQVQEEFGFEIKNGRAVERADANWKTIIANIIEARNEMVAAGAMLRRVQPFRGTMRSVSIKISRAARQAHDAIMRKYDVAFARAARGQAKGSVESLRTGESTVWAEEQKIPHAVKRAQEIVAAGGKVVIVVSRVAGGQKSRISGNQYEGIAPKLVEQLRQAGLKIGEIYGTGAGVQRKRTEAIAGFQAGTLDGVVMTAKSGAASIELDDIVGDAPRTMLVLTKDFSGDVFDQMQYRISRSNTASDATIEFLSIDDIHGDVRRGDILSRKLAILEASRSGVDPDVAALVYSEEVGESIESSAAMPTGSTSIRWPWQSSDPALNRRLEERIREGSSLEALLDIIATDSNDQMLRDLAVTIRPLVGGLIERVGSRAPLGTSGQFSVMYDPITGAIGGRKLSVDPGLLGLPFTTPVGNLLRRGRSRGLVHTLLHEAVHAVTVEHIARNPALRRELQRLAKRALKVAVQSAGPAFDYGFTNIDEFIAEAFSNPEFQKFLKSIPASGPTARTQVTTTRMLQRGDTKVRTLWDLFVGIVSRLMHRLGIGHNRVDNQAYHTSLFDQLLELDAMVDPRTLEPASIDAVRESIMREHGAAMVSATSPLLQVARGNGVQFKNWFKDHVFEPRKAALHVMFRSHIVQVYSKVFDIVVDIDGTPVLNGLKAWARATDMKDVTARKYQKLAEELFGRWEAWAVKNVAEARAMNRVMHDATMFNVDPSKAFPTKTLKDGRVVPAGSKTQQAAHTRLKAEYDALPREAQGLFNSVKLFYEVQFNRTVELLTDNILYWTLTDSTRSKEIADQVKSLADFDRIAAAHPDLFTDVALVDARAALADVFSMRNRTVYFPLRRYGEHVARAVGTKTGRWTAEEVTDILAEQPGLRVKERGDTEDAQGRREYTLELKSVEFFESRNDADIRHGELYDELDALGYTSITIPPVDKRQKFAGSELSTNGFAALERSLRLRNKGIGGTDKTAQLAADMLHQAVLSLMPDTSVRKAQMQRRGIRGASLDMRRAMSEYAINGSHYMANLEHGRHIRTALRAMDEVTRRVSSGATPGDITVLRDVYNHILKLEDHNVSIRQRAVWEQKLTSLGFVWYLGSLSYSMVNATQPLVLTYPWLAARAGGNYAQGLRTSARALTQAYKAVAPEVMNKRPFTDTGKSVLRGFRNMPTSAQLMEYLQIRTDSTGATKITISNELLANIKRNYGPTRGAEIQRMVEAVAEAGLIDVSLVLDMREAVRGPSYEVDERGAIRRYPASVANGIVEAARVLPHATEVMNRTVTAIAAYEVALQRGDTVEQATEFAIEAVDATQFNYNTANNAQILNTRLPGIPLVFQFKKHVMNMFYMVIRNAIQSFNYASASKEERSVARKTVFGILASHAVVGGVLGMTPEPVKWAIGLAVMAFGAAGGDTDDWEGWDIEVRQALYDAFGPTMGEVFSRGLPRLVGVDLSNRINLDQMLFFGEPRGTTADEIAAYAARMALGPVAGIGFNLVDAARAFNRGDIQRGVEKSTPKAVRDLVRAGGLATHGVRDSYGNTILMASDADPLDFFFQVMGFQPSQVAELYEQRNAVFGRRNTIDTKRKALLERFGRAGNHTERWAIRREIREFNRDHGRDVPSARITGETLERSRKQRKLQSEAARTGDVYTRGMERYYSEAGRFANR